MEQPRAGAGALLPAGTLWCACRRAEPQVSVGTLDEAVVEVPWPLPVVFRNAEMRLTQDGCRGGHSAGWLGACGREAELWPEDVL